MSASASSTAGAGSASAGCRTGCTAALPCPCPHRYHQSRSAAARPSAPAARTTPRRPPWCRGWGCTACRCRCRRRRIREISVRCHFRCRCHGRHEGGQSCAMIDRLIFLEIHWWWSTGRPRQRNGLQRDAFICCSLLSLMRCQRSEEYGELREKVGTRCRCADQKILVKSEGARTSMTVVAFFPMKDQLACTSWPVPAPSSHQQNIKKHAWSFRFFVCSFEKTTKCHLGVLSFWASCRLATHYFQP